MKKGKVTFNQVMISIVLFNFGSSVVMGVSTSVGQEAWIPILLATLVTIPLFLIYGRILTMFPEKDIFDIMDILFGKICGKIGIALFAWYAIYLCALVLRNFSEFTQISAMPETPQLPIMILMILTTIYMARSGVRTLGKWGIAVFFFVVFVVLFTFITSIPQAKVDDLLPIGEHTRAQFAESTFQIFSFPYAETVIFLGMAGSFKKNDNPYKLLFYALAITLVVFLLVFLRNLTLLGPTMMRASYFPSYVTARIIGISDFLARIESTISSNFLFAGIVKITVCLLAASKGLASLFGLKDYRILVLPLGMFAMALCSILYKNTMEMFAFLEYYPYFAFPFQVILPLLVWIGGELYVRKHKQERNI
ncbi:MAG: endospore germination permease [Clostridiales bacterium]